MLRRSPILSFDSSRVDFTPYGFTCELWSPTHMARPDRHNEIEINFLPSGRLTYLLGGRHATIEADRVALFWGAIPHQIVDWDTQEPYYVATLPLSSFLSWGIPDAVARSVLAGEIVEDVASTPADADRFHDWLQDFQSRESLRERVAQTEIQARVLRLAATLSARRSPLRREDGSKATRRSSLARADQIACHIAQHYAEPLTADEIARAVGLHSNYAMAVFRRAFGTTIGEFLIQHRISHAQRMLITTDERVIEIASAAGFQSLSRFNEAFKRACGCSPRDYRRAHRAS